MIVKEGAIVFSEPASQENQQIWLEIESNLIVVKGHPQRFDCVLSKPDVLQLIDALSNYMVSGQFHSPTTSQKVHPMVRVMMC